jgi:hypothetical protein
MSNLLLRSFSQGLQAFLPIAVASAWLRATGDASGRAAVRLGLVLAAAATIPASWYFQHTVHQAFDEMALAVLALVLVCFFGRRARIFSPQPRSDLGERVSKHLSNRRGTAFWATAAAAATIVVRQTMEIGSTFATAAFDLRSLDATSAVAQGALMSLVVATLWTWWRRRLSHTMLVAATRAFVAVFLAQLLLYAFHESAEARVLPWSDVLHAATEPYGPDGIYGVHFSDLLVVIPLAAVCWTAAASRVSAALRLESAAFTRQRAAVGMLAVSAVIVSGGQGGDVQEKRGEPASAADLAAVLSRPHVLFRDTSAGPRFGMLSAAPLDAPESKRVATGLTCERVAFAAGHGICLHANRGLLRTYSAMVLDASLKPGAAAKLEGKPSRTRVAPDGRVGATTVFVVGDSYGAEFSTRTALMDLSGGDVIGDLEQFTTWRNGARIRAADFNFWGVTFARDGNTFYASLRTAGTTYLVRGELALRKVTVLHENVECPSLSPDERRIAFKKHVGPGGDGWRLAVLDLATMRERLISGESRWIDDQVEWLDNRRVLYAVPRRTTATFDVWVGSVDDDMPARIFLREAESPIVVHSR